MYISIFILVLLYELTAGSPLTSKQERPAQELKFQRALLNSPDTSATDRIIMVNKEQTRHLYEGDIILTAHDDVDTRNHGDIDGPLKNTVKRNAQRIRNSLWITKEVPYEIHDDLILYKPNIDAAIEQFTRHTCVRWVPYTNQKNWVKFVKKDGCSSAVGRKYWLTGPQEVSLGSGCNHRGTIMHEMLHAIGFWHEQSRPDRNHHVEVMWENIAKDEEHNFNKYRSDAIDVLNTNYDYDSIMHYGKYAFSKNGNPTLLSINDPERELGQREDFSEIDIVKINALYDCKNNPGESGWSLWSAWGFCNDECYKARQRFCASSDPETFCPGANYYGVETDAKDCTQEECNAPVDGHWGRWSSWSTCSKSCGIGKQTRTRFCDDPLPKKSGKTCVGLKMNEQSCKMLTCGIGPDGCEFENNMCHWYQPSQNTYRWERLMGETPSSSTGPSGDHTTRKGHYVYAEASPAIQGQTANLVSKEFLPTDGRCITFYYHMYGEGMGTLNVFVNETSTSNVRLIFTKSDNQGDVWKKGNATIRSQGRYQVVFQAVRGGTFHSDIGIDDITFKDSPCSATPTKKRTKSHATQAPTRAPTKPPTTRATTASATTRISTPPSTTQAPTRAPTKPPTTRATTPSSTTRVPTEPSTTRAPTKPPTTRATTPSSTTRVPTEPSTTRAPTKPPTTRATTPSATTRVSIPPFTTQPPTRAPTKPPTTRATTPPSTPRMPTEPSTTRAPTKPPTTRATTPSATTRVSTPPSTTQPPTRAPAKPLTTRATTPSATTKVPTPPSTTQPPTRAPIKPPTTRATTPSATSRVPTPPSTTQPPTQPPTRAPTKPLTTRATTPSSTTRVLTEPFTTRAPSRAPTQLPTTTAPTTVATTKQPTLKPICRDYNILCAYWSSMMQCQINPRYMEVYCKKSCNLCKKNCEDHNIYCQYWASTGNCWSNPKYMNVYCRKSCKICKQDNSCYDSASSHWCYEYRYYCKSDHSFRQRCRKTCHLCT